MVINMTDSTVHSFKPGLQLIIALTYQIIAVHDVYGELKIQHFCLLHHVIL